MWRIARRMWRIARKTLSKYACKTLSKYACKTLSKYACKTRSKYACKTLSKYALKTFIYACKTLSKYACKTLRKYVCKTLSNYALKTLTVYTLVKHLVNARLEIPLIKYRQAQEPVRPMFYYEKGKLSLETVHICTKYIFFPKRKLILVVETLYLMRNSVITPFRPHNRCRYFMCVISSREMYGISVLA